MPVTATATALLAADERGSHYPIVKHYRQPGKAKAFGNSVGTPREEGVASSAGSVPTVFPKAVAFSGPVVVNGLPVVGSASICGCFFAVAVRSSSAAEAIPTGVTNNSRLQRDAAHVGAHVETEFVPSPFARRSACTPRARAMLERLLKGASSTSRKYSTALTAAGRAKSGADSRREGHGAMVGRGVLRARRLKT